MIENQTEKKVKKLRTDNGMEFCLKEFNAYCKARCMLSNAGLHRHFWAEAASTACYLINRSPSIVIDKKTPIEVWSGSPADYSQLRVFGCTAYAHIDNGKLEPRAVKCIFLGYKPGGTDYKLWNSQTQKVVISMNVIFNESVMLPNNLSTDVPVEK